MLRHLVGIFIYFIVFNLSNATDDIHNMPREKSKALKNNWEVVTGVKSISDKKFKGTLLEVQKKDKGEVFVKRPRVFNRPLLEVEDESESQVVYNPKKMMTGFLPGTILINFRENTDFESAILDFPVKIIRLDKELNFAIVKVNKGSDLDKTQSDLKKDKRFKDVELEIVTKNIKPL